MNFLGHYYLNHGVRRLEAEPHFVLGVALPDLWGRLSPSRRIRWATVRGATPIDADAVALQAGLLNHAQADQWFHCCPAFVRWQQAVRRAVPRADAHPAVHDFLGHVACELALDRALIQQDDGLPHAFYSAIERCRWERVEPGVAEVTGVAPQRLSAEVQAFAQRRFLEQYVSLEALLTVMHYVLSRTRVRSHPDDPTLMALLDAAASVVSVSDLWAERAD